MNAMLNDFRSNVSTCCDFSHDWTVFLGLIEVMNVYWYDLVRSVSIIWWLVAKGGADVEVIYRYVHYDVDLV